MPLLSYFVVVGSALMALVYLAGAMLPHDNAPIYISSQIDGVPAPRQPQPQQADEPTSRLKPTTSFAAAPAPNVDKSLQDVHASVSSELQTPPPKKRKTTPRQREWQESFAQSGGWWHDDRRRFEQRRRNDGWRERDRGWRDRESRGREWRGPFWESNRRGWGWR
jgi:hypothetical protein